LKNNAFAATIHYHEVVSSVKFVLRVDGSKNEHEHRPGNIGRREHFESRTQMKTALGQIEGGYDPPISILFEFTVPSCS